MQTPNEKRPPPKRETDGKPPDPQEAELVEDMQMDVMDYIFGRGTDGIVRMLKESTNTSESMATAAYKAVRLSAEKHKATASIAMDMDMMLGVSTSAVEMMMEVAEAAGQVDAGTNKRNLQDDTLMRMVVMHGETVERTPERKSAAMTDLRDYLKDDGAQKAFDYVNKRAKDEGLSTDDMQRRGNQMLYGTKTPVEDKLKAGMKKGLMDQQDQAVGGLQPTAQPDTTPEPPQVPPGSAQQPMAQPDPMAQPQPAPMAQPQGQGSLMGSAVPPQQRPMEPQNGELR